MEQSCSGVNWLQALRVGLSTRSFQLDRGTVVLWCAYQRISPDFRPGCVGPASSRAESVSAAPMAAGPGMSVASLGAVSASVISSTRGRSNCLSRKRNSANFLLSVFSTTWSHRYSSPKQLNEVLARSCVRSGRSGHRFFSTSRWQWGQDPPTPQPHHRRIRGRRRRGVIPRVISAARIAQRRQNSAPAPDGPFTLAQRNAPPGATGRRRGPEGRRWKRGRRAMGEMAYPQP